MRKTLTNLIKEKDYFIHADMWNIKSFPFKNKVNIIDTGLGETNLVNISSGIASQNKNIYIYGVCGFIIYRLEQLKYSLLKFGSVRGKIIICNAGKYGYNNLGYGHVLDDDIQLMEMLNIPYFAPKNTKEFEDIIFDIEKKDTGIFYIQLGKDEV